MTFITTNTYTLFSLVLFLVYGVAAYYIIKYKKRKTEDLILCIQSDKFDNEAMHEATKMDLSQQNIFCIGILIVTCVLLIPGIREEGNSTFLQIIAASLCAAGAVCLYDFHRLRLTQTLLAYPLDKKKEDTISKIKKTQKCFTVLTVIYFIFLSCNIVANTGNTLMTQEKTTKNLITGSDIIGTNGFHNKEQYYLELSDPLETPKVKVANYDDSCKIGSYIQKFASVLSLLYFYPESLNSETRVELQSLPSYDAGGCDTIFITHEITRCGFRYVKDYDVHHIKDVNITKNIRELYEIYILGGKELTEVTAHKYFTDNMMEKLKKEYDEEYDDGGGLAVWTLRSGAQDGPGDSKIVSVDNLIGDIYIIDFYDMGYECSVKLFCVKTKEGLKIDEFEIIGNTAPNK